MRSCTEHGQQCLKNKLEQEWHISNLVTFVRIYLMSYIDMGEWLNLCIEETHSPPKWTYT